VIVQLESIVAAVVTATWISKVFPDVTPSAVFSWTTQLATPVPPLAACAIAGPINVASPSWRAVPVNLNPEQKSAPVPTLLTPIDMELICDTPLGTTKLSPELANWLFMLWKEVVAESAASVRVTTIAIVYALTLIGPREARTGEPREKERTAAFAKNAPTRVLVIACLFDFADFDKVVKPELRSPAKNDFIAEPALVCSKRAKAAPVSITLIPKEREGFLLARARRLTILWRQGLPT